MFLRKGFALLCLLVGSLAVAQETRSMLFGKVLDPQGASITGASVVIRNAETGIAQTMKSSDKGYYEGNLLMPGNYEITAEAKGFKKLVRHGVTLPVASRIQVDMAMEIGGVTETVSVTGEAPLLETNAVSSGRVIDNKSLMELPVMGNSAILLVKLAPGIQTGGVNNYLALHSNAAARTTASAAMSAVTPGPWTARPIKAPPAAPPISPIPTPSPNSKSRPITSTPASASPPALQSP